MTEQEQAQAEMASHDQWVSHVLPKLSQALAATRVEDVVQGRDPDRVANMATFTQGIVVEAEKAGRAQHWSYETVVVRLCAALYQLAEARIETDGLRATLPLEGNRRSGGLPPRDIV